MVACSANTGQDSRTPRAGGDGGQGSEKIAKKGPTRMVIVSPNTKPGAGVSK